jgi:phospholipid transport system substrate-binding protein
VTVYWLSRRRALRLIAVRLLAATVIAIGLVGLANTADADDSPILAPIRQLCDALLDVMKMGKTTPFEQRFTRLAPVIDQAFDLSTILQVSIGPIWSNIPPDQHAALLTAFRRYTVASYVNSFDNYAGQRIEVDPEPRSLGNGEMVAGTRVVPTSGDTHRLDYVMRQNGAVWQAVDVLADGTISRVAVQRSDFRRLLMSGGGPALLTMLQQKTADLSGGALQ